MPLRLLLIRPKTEFADMILGIPIGLSLMAAVAESQNHTVEILDLALEPSIAEAEKKLQERLSRQSYDVVGLSCMTVEYESARKVSHLVRLRQPECRIVFGGQHPTIHTGKVLSDSGCDYVVVGEGEETFRELLSCLEQLGNPAGIAGLAYKKEGEVFTNPVRPLISSLDDIPLPAYHLLALERYFALESARYAPKHPRAMQIFTSRGCPWHCIYCHSLFGKAFRARSAANVLEEMQRLYARYGVREFMIEDDVFNLDMQRAKEICDRIVRSGMKIHMQFGNGMRLERFDRELAQKLARAGTHHIAIGIESANPRIQHLIRKNVRLDTADEVIGWLRESGIRTLGFFMIGFPFEKVEEIEQTIQYAAASRLDEALFSIVVPYAGTQLHQMVHDMGLYDAETVGIGGEGLSQLRSEYWDFATLKRLQRKAYLRFFLSRGRFLKLLPRLLHPRLAKKYGNALVRNFLPFLSKSSSRIN